MRLNLGSGEDSREGFVNVDLRADVADVVADVRRLPFADGSASEIVAFDVLEHFWRDDVPLVLAEWRRVLQPSAILTLRVPNLPELLRRLDTTEHLNAVTNIYGGHRWGPDGSLDTHHWGWSPRSLLFQLSEAGFGVRSNDGAPNMTVEAVRA